MEMREVVDLSSFLLFEACGDSEAAADTDLGFEPAVELRREEVEEDAESCSYDSFGGESKCIDEKINTDNGEEWDEEEEEEEEEDGDTVDQIWSADDFASSVPRKKAKDCVDSKEDKDRLFWENCLAT